MSSIRYQPHIDGLRAVAVLLVILHHLGDWAGTRGGYVGVDVFFVISGFLITSIVRKELEVGGFTFGGFYKRRIVRLAPAYFTVLLVTTVAALIWMLPAELLAYARSMVSSSLFLANFHMWKEVGGYFGADAHTAPLLHLWSLAVEEQFYLFWPIALLLGHRLLGKRSLPWVVLAVAIIGAIVSQWGVARYPAASYYLLPTRFFELAVGAWLAYLPAVVHGNRRGSLLASIIGMGLILYGAAIYGKETLFPGYKAMAPVVGTALLLRWGAEGPVGRLLGTPLAVGIGKISYPAYLWHWPIISFLYINEVAISVPVGMGVLVATFVLSWLTYQILELPARRHLTRGAARVVVIGAGLPIAASVAIAFGIAALHGLPGRFPDSLNKKSEALLAFPNKARGRCNEGPPTNPLPPDDCVLGRPGGKVDFLLVGDSHANHFTGFLDELGKEAGMRGYDMTRSNTPYLPGVDRWSIREGAEDHHENFVPRNNYITGLLQRTRFDVIILAGNWTGFARDELIRSGGATGDAALEIGLRRAIEKSLIAADRVILLATIPLLEQGLHDCTLRAERFNQSLDCSQPVSKYQAQTKSTRAIFERIQQSYPRVVRIEPSLVLCDQEVCATELEGVPAYKDSGHLNDIGSRRLARIWLEKYGNPLLLSSTDGLADYPKRQGN